MWNTDDSLVGQRVWINCGYGDEEIATVLAVSTKTANIRVKTDDGRVMSGNQWDNAE